ncbi:LLM class flavin-dependent oxidoreductase [Microbacterium sp. BWT-B31]|uniref:LLM class flavin-dependent oxidoreductase n=1 Tax=Microbacterium sp. BWT-B31 TaxID=3232072 RepID=UPI0035281133
MPEALVSIGVAGALGPAAIAHIAAVVESAGFHALWVNDAPGGDSLAALAAAAAVTDTLVLATGVVPVDRRPARSLVDAVRALPQERTVLGIGSGSGGVGALARVREAVGVLRDQTRVRVLVGALGPKMRALAATDADGPLLSWLTPDAAAAQSATAHELSPDAHVALYVRTAVDPAAVSALEAEADRYGGYPSYAANFARLGIRPGDTVLRPEGFGPGIRRYRAAVDEVVLRAIVAGDDYAGFVEAAAARLG